MARKLRSAEINEAEVGVYHVTTRCVRRAFLMGKDSVLAKCFDFRRLWLLGRLIWLAKVFKIDIVGFSIMANHLHLILRNRPDLVKNMSDEEVILAWWRISPRYRKSDGSRGRLTSKRLRKLLDDEDHIAAARDCRVSRGSCGT